MFLEKLEIQGFKSFANKNILVFPGMLEGCNKRGITSIVGPNGSGKSNVADAVRWVLGEQSMKTLRGKKAEDIIFSGSDKKGKLGMAEVSLFLNNEASSAISTDIGRAAEDSGQTGGISPMDYSQIVITRRLYRSGDSEYMLNNSRSRLSDIQIMLSKAKFGQKTYSVIGQGMVEGFLNTSLAERKEFFDEATGVKQYQIKRDNSLNKLRGSYENLIQAMMLLSEIEPRLRSLTRQVNKLKKRGEIESELRELQYKYYSKIWHEINGKFSQYNNQFLELEKEKFTKDKKLAGINRELDKLKEESAGGNEFADLQNELNQAQNAKESVNKKLAKLEARTEVKLEASGQFDLSFFLNKKEELNKEIKSINEEMGMLKKNIDTDKAKEKELGQEKRKIEEKIEQLNSSLSAAGPERSGYGIKKINEFLNGALYKLKQVGKETNVVKIQEIIRAIEGEFARVLSITSKCADSENNETEKRWQQIHQSLKELARVKEEHIAKINDNNLRISARSERVKLLSEKTAGLNEEINSIAAKLKQKSTGQDLTAVYDEHNNLKNELTEIENKIKGIRGKIDQASALQESRKNQLFSSQNSLQNLQNEINALNNQLNEIKINSTRYETKLEDLEIEIREELGSLKEIKRNKAGRKEIAEDAQENIRQLKRQLELIGGIDPQIEREYNEAKERYDFLSGQAGDLNSAIESLEKVIKELDLTIKDQFDKEFKIIAKKFEQYFKILFHGGSAKIIKVMDQSSSAEAADGKIETTEDEASGERGADNKKEEKKLGGIADLKRIKFLQKHNATGLAGIEIQATPPGKKIKSISVLSGGERALTAIALICAIISANPSPFVVLDEVDAALDEANSKRLAKILEELSHKTQFIVITHNRTTMRKANILYGITMGDDGVSKLLSIKLDEAGKHVR